MGEAGGKDFGAEGKGTRAEDSGGGRVFLLGEWLSRPRQRGWRRGEDRFFLWPHKLKRGIGRRTLEDLRFCNRIDTPYLAVAGTATVRNGCVLHDLPDLKGYEDVSE